MTKTEAETETETRTGSGTRTRTRTCEHRQTEKRDGKTYCRDCKRQIYL